MSPSRRSKHWLLVVVALIAGVALLNVGFGYLYDQRHIDASQLERELRAELPVGSSQTRVKDVLRDHKLTSQYEGSSGSIVSVARDVRGTSLIIRKDVAFTFRFDDALQLRSIESQTHLTGP